MLDYQSVREKKATIQDLVKGLTKDDLRRELDEMVGEIHRRIADATDADIVFQPNDPKANDPFAKEGEAEPAWTLGYVIVHLTASMEEAASISQELARRRGISTDAHAGKFHFEKRRRLLSAVRVWQSGPYVFRFVGHVARTAAHG